MREDELITRADANFRDTVQRWAKASAAGRICEQEGLLITASGVPIRSFNNVFVTRPFGDLSRLLGETCAYFKSQGLPFRLRVRDGVHGATENIIVASGLHRSGGIPCLVLSPLTRRGTDRPPLEIRRVIDNETLRHHVEVVAGGFGWPPVLLGQILSEALIDDAAWRVYVGYANGRPVAASQLITTDGVAGVYLVATLEEFRRRGFGEAISWHAIREGAAAGCNLASLQASEMGYPIYERMGFRTVTHYRTFVPQEVQSCSVRTN